MINKKLLVVALLLSQQSLSGELYLRGGYHGEFVNYVGSLKIKDVNNYVRPSKINKINNHKSNYNPLFSAGIAFGYQGESGNRYELELVQSQVKRASHTHRPINICYSNKQRMITVNNDRIENTAIIANAYYQKRNNRSTFSPYIGAGVGLTRIKMFEKISIRPAYQLKAGLNSFITKNVSVYLGYRHFGVIGGNFTDFKVVKRVHPRYNFRTTNNSIQSSFFCTHGIEVGMTIYFAAKSPFKVKSNKKI
ncbi:MAG: P44/Msp2 family outer membrane protein [Wolbachia endosymbiont of Tyrophagus putrescentiae]|nr:P44/Msp2 family outer membrane protein [Wolbachia endosymbiont of Tyrophagus putrescentiae]